MREFILAIFEPLVNLLIFIYTIAGFIFGGVVGGMGGLFGGPSFSMGNAVIGALIGFTFGALSSGAIFLLLRMSEVLEEQLYMMREQERKRNKTETR
jgi:hypothetical protein